MYWHILKKDLKRKKTMNVILLLFMILASMFIASSINQAISISTALDRYFDKAGLSDVLILTMKDPDNDQQILSFLDENEEVERYTYDETIYMTDSNFFLENGEKLHANTACLTPIGIHQQKFFNSLNEEITQIENNEIYLPLKTMHDNGLHAGNVLLVRRGALSMKLTIRDNCKDAFLGSSMMGVQRFLVSEENYQKLKMEEDPSIGGIYSITAHDSAALQKAAKSQPFHSIVICDRAMVATTYVMDMIIAAMLLVVSVCLILISFVILRFTITFTLSEEFREIGIMKAIGIGNRKIRGLYLVKYLTIALVGCTLGGVASIPFGNIFLSQVSDNILIGDALASVWINICCCIFVVVLIVWFAYFCTRRVRQFTPIDAIHNGTTGERFHRKSLLRIGKSHLRTIPFLALNDILSGLKRYVVMLLAFTLGTMLLIIPINTVNTLSSDSLIECFHMISCDLCLNEEIGTVDMVKYGREQTRATLQQYEEELADVGIPAEVVRETLLSFRIRHEDQATKVMAIQGTGLSADRYPYLSGTAPMLENEVALTHVTAKQLDAAVGDTVYVTDDGVEAPYVVTALYESMNNMGEGFRFSEAAEPSYRSACGFMSIQISYTDHPDENTIRERADTIQAMYPEAELQTVSEWLGDMLGGITDQINNIKQLIVLVVLLIDVLVAVLMVKSFLAKEKSEIAMLKAIGFGNGALVRWQSLRIGFVLIFSTILGTLLSNPVGQVSAGQAFKLMGANHIQFIIRPLEVYVAYPFLIFAVTMLASMLTALQLRRISAQETNNME